MTELSTRQLLERTAHLAADYREAVGERKVRALLSAAELERALAAPLTDSGESPARVIESLAQLGARGSRASAGARFFDDGKTISRKPDRRMVRIGQ